MKPKDVRMMDELAEGLQVPKSTFYRLAQEGEVPGQLFAEHWRLQKVAIDRGLDEIKLAAGLGVHSE